MKMQRLQEILTVTLIERFLCLHVDFSQDEDSVSTKIHQLRLDRVSEQEFPWEMYTV